MLIGEYKKPYVSRYPMNIPSLPRNIPDIPWTSSPGQVFWSAARQRLLHSPWPAASSARTGDGCGAEHPLVAQGSVLHSPLASWPGRSWKGRWWLEMTLSMVTIAGTDLLEVVLYIHIYIYVYIFWCKAYARAQEIYTFKSYEMAIEVWTNWNNNMPSDWLGILQTNGETIDL